jgi:hypothetical protein
MDWREEEDMNWRECGVKGLERIKEMGVESKEIRIGEDEGKEWREGHAKGLERRKERS